MNRADLPDFPDLCESDPQHKGVTKSIFRSFGEAACLCLARHHTSPATLKLMTDADQRQYNLTWEEVTTVISASYAQPEEATEKAACCMAIAACQVYYGYYVVGRAPKRSGADYYLGEPQAADDGLNFEESFRLEVSGIDSDPQGGEMRRRLLQKVAQLRRGNSDLPGLASVVVFSEPVIRFRYVL